MLNKGFTMIEALLVLFIMSLFTTLFMPKNSDTTYKDQILIYKLSNSLINNQIKSLKSHSKNCLDDPHLISQYPVCFNQNGNINLSQKIRLVNNNFSITLFLGAGSHEIK